MHVVCCIEVYVENNNEKDTCWYTRRKRETIDMECQEQVQKIERRKFRLGKCAKPQGVSVRVKGFWVAFFILIRGCESEWPPTTVLGFFQVHDQSGKHEWDAGFSALESSHHGMSIFLRVGNKRIEESESRTKEERERNHFPLSL